MGFDKLAITQTTYETVIQAIADALEGGAYSTARQKLAVAKVYAAALPDLAVAGRTINRGTAFSQLRDLEAAIDAHERAAAGTGAMRLTPISFGRPS